MENDSLDNLHEYEKKHPEILSELKDPSMQELLGMNSNKTKVNLSGTGVHVTYMLSRVLLVFSIIIIIAGIILTSVIADQIGGDSAGGVFLIFLSIGILSLFYYALLAAISTSTKNSCYTVVYLREILKAIKQKEKEEK